MNIKKYSILHTMRHPLEALNSPIRNWLNYKEGKFFFPKELYFQYDLALNGLSDLVSINKKTCVVLLENLLTHKKIKNAVNILYFYFKRLFLLNKIFVKNKVLPCSIRSNNQKNL